MRSINKWGGAFCAALAIFSFPAWAENANIRGVGVTTCSDAAAVLRSSDGAQTFAFIQWIEGALTGASIERGVVDVFPLLRSIDAAEYILLVCQEDPFLNQPVAMALRETLDRLDDFEIGSADTINVTDQDSGVTVSIYSSAIRPLQRILGENGISVGGADGVYGNLTARGLNTVNEQIGVTIGGLPVGRTLYVLTRDGHE